MTAYASGEEYRKQIVLAIVDLTAIRGKAPAYRDIIEYLGMKSNGHLWHHLSVLRERGIVAPGDRTAGIRLTDHVAAGVPLQSLSDEALLAHLEGLRHQLEEAKAEVDRRIAARPPTPSDALP